MMLTVLLAEHVNAGNRGILLQKSYHRRVMKPSSNRRSLGTALANACRSNDHRTHEQAKCSTKDKALSANRSRGLDELTVAFGRVAALLLHTWHEGKSQHWKQTQQRKK